MAPSSERSQRQAWFDRWPSGSDIVAVNVAPTWGGLAESQSVASSSRLSTLIVTETVAVSGEEMEAVTLTL